MTLAPGEIVAWLIAGLAAGWAAGKISRGRVGLIGDLAVGLIGALTGGLIAGLFVPGDEGVLPTAGAALTAAAILLALIRLAGARRMAV
jgi:uncharacterized membrane protein YeaQ/YmgE (transglycosylase-associated protein family)